MPGHHLLVHEQRPDGVPAAESRTRRRRRAVAGATVGAEPGLEDATSSTGVQTSQAVGPRRSAHERCRPAGRAGHPAAVVAVHRRRSRCRETEVDVQPAVIGEAEEEVLAVGLRGEQRPAVEERGALREAALRAADRAWRRRRTEQGARGAAMIVWTLGARHAVAVAARAPRCRGSAADADQPPRRTDAEAVSRTTVWGTIGSQTHDLRVGERPTGQQVDRAVGTVDEPRPAAGRRSRAGQHDLLVEARHQAGGA